MKSFIYEDSKVRRKQKIIKGNNFYEKKTRKNKHGLYSVFFSYSTFHKKVDFRYFTLNS